jgi:glycerate-2-kinase
VAPEQSDLLQILTSGIDAVRAAAIFPPVLKYLDSKSEESEKRFLLTLGKASVDSAKFLLSRRNFHDHFVLSPYQDPDRQLNVFLGSHPIPDHQSQDSTKRLVEWLEQLPSGGSLLVVLSGGSSALCVLPLPNVPLKAKMKVNDLLIRSGATIQEINTVRKHLSSVKGGQLARRVSHLQTRVLVISDVIGNDLSTIGSGPFYPDPTTFLDARNVLIRHDLWSRIPEEARFAIEKGCAGHVAETPKPGSFQIEHQIVASNEIARTAAAEKAKSLGYSIRFQETPLSMNVDEAAEELQFMLKSAPENTALIAGGEITVSVHGEGTGGRNQHLALLMTQKLEGTSILFAAAGTDGIDGNSPAAGAWTDGNTFARAGGMESFQKAAIHCDSYHYFRSIGQSITTGPSGTNVMDLYIALT